MEEEGENAVSANDYWGRILRRVSGGEAERKCDQNGRTKSIPRAFIHFVLRPDC
jgi:hypothetical protein